MLFNFDCYLLFLELYFPLWPVKEDNLHIHILPVFMEKIFKEVRDWLVGDMSADHDMSGI